MKSNYTKAAATAAIALTLSGVVSPLVQVHADAQPAPVVTGDKATVGNVKVIYRVGETGKVLYTGNVSGKIGERFNIETPTDVQGYFPDITSPNTSTVAGGQPGEAVVSELGSKLLFSGDFDEANRTVTFNFYAPNSIVKVNYIDDTTEQLLETKETEGPVHSEPIGFNYDNILNNYKANGYELVSSDYNAADPFYTGQKDIAYTVHLKHVIDSQPESKEIARVINFNDETGNPIATRNTQLVTFNRATEYDHVTGKTTTTPWDKASYTFPAVDAQKVIGYDSNSGQKALDETVTPDSQSSVFNYGYTTKTVAAEVRVKDTNDSTKTIDLPTIKLEGKFNTDAKFDKAKTIADLSAKGYEVVATDVPDKITFKSEDTSIYNIQLKHQVKTTTETKKVTRTLNFNYSDGDVAFYPITQSVDFTRNVSEDQVTHEKTYTDWALASSDNSFEAFKTPNIKGYDFNIANAEKATNVTANDANTSIKVIYTAKDAEAKVNFIDSVTGETISTDHYADKFGKKIAFSQDTLNDLKSKGYNVISDETSNGARYDDGANNFTVSLGHDVETKTDTKIIKRTFNYVNKANNGVLQTFTQEVKFTKETNTDKVTGKVTVGDWKSDKDFFDTFAFPGINGFQIDDGQTKIAKLEKVTIDSKDETTPVLYTEATTTAPVNPIKPNQNGTTSNGAEIATKGVRSDLSVTDEEKADNNDPKTGLKETANSPILTLGLLITGAIALIGSGFMKKKVK